MTHNPTHTPLRDWEEHASVVVAGSLYSHSATEEDKARVNSHRRSWNFFVLISALVFLFSFGWALYEWQTGKNLLDFFSSDEISEVEPAGALEVDGTVSDLQEIIADSLPTSPSEEGSELATPQNIAVQPALPFEFTDVQAYTNYFSGYWGVAKWLALSVLLAHLWVLRLVGSAFQRVVRHWRFVLAHSEGRKASKLEAPQASGREKEAMVATTFWGFWRKTTLGIPLTPTGMRVFLTLLFCLVYAGLVYLAVLPSPVG